MELSADFCVGNPYKPQSGSEILAELAGSGACYQAGEGDAAKMLSMTADSLKMCDNPVLAKYGYRKIRFANHT